MITLQIILAFGMLGACATSPGKKVKTSAMAAQDRNLAELQKYREEERQDRKDRARVLNKKNEMNVAFKAVPQRKKLEFSPKLLAQADTMRDKDLYAELLNAYNANDILKFQSYYKSFSKRFLKSPLADDAIYLNGMFALTEKEYGKALIAFNQIQDKYPFSNKSTAAIYAKGVCLKRMNLKDESKEVFVKLIKKYPGSPEALRAKVELGQVK